MSFIIYEDDALVVLDKPAGCSSEEGVPQRLREQWGKPDAYVASSTVWTPASRA